MPGYGQGLCSGRACARAHPPYAKAVSAGVHSLRFTLLQARLRSTGDAAERGLSAQLQAWQAQRGAMDGVVAALQEHHTQGAAHLQGLRKGEARDLPARAHARAPPVLF